MINYTILPTDDVVVGNQPTEDITITLPLATGSGKSYQIKNINTSTVIVDGNGSETLDGALTKTLNQWESIIVVDRATGAWAIILGGDTYSFSFGNSMLLMGA